MSIPVIIQGTIIDFPSSGQSPDWSSAVIQFAEAVSQAFTSTLVINTVSSDYSATINDNIIQVNAIGGPISITLPTPSLVTGKIFYIQKIDASTNTVTVVGTINGQSNFIIHDQWELISIYSDGTQYELIAHTILANVTITTQNSDYSVQNTDGVVRGDASSGDITLTLPSASSVTGRIYYFIKIDSSVNTVIIAGTINGASNFILTNQYQAISLYSNGTNYEILGKAYGLTNSDLSGSAGITGSNIASATITGSNIATNTVANSNLSQVPTLTLKGNNTGGTGNVADLTVSQVNAMLGDIITIGAFNNTSTANGLDLTSQVLTLHATDGTNPGALSITTQTISGSKTFTDNTFFNGGSVAIGSSSTGTSQAAGSLFITPSLSGLSISNPSEAPLLIETDGVTQGAFIGFRTSNNTIAGLQVNEGTNGAGAQFRYTWTGTAGTSHWEFLGNGGSTLGQIASDATWTMGKSGFGNVHKIFGNTVTSASTGSIIPPGSIALYLQVNINGTVYNIPCYNHD